MEKFYVEVTDKDVSELIQKKVREAGISKIYIPKEHPLDLRAIAFNYSGSKDLAWATEPDFYKCKGLPKFTIDQALQYFRELKSENEKPKFKVGDWVVPKNGADIKAEQIIEINSGFGHTSFVYAPGCQYPPDYVRHATPAEIEQAQKFTINRHEMTVDGNIISFGCAKFHKAQFMTLDNFNDCYPCSNRKIKSITLDSGVTLTIEDITKILERLK